MNNFGYGGANAHVIMEDYHSFVSSQHGLANGAKERTNGFTNGVNGHTNGFTNGVNGHTNGLSNGVKGHQTKGVNGHQTDGFTNGEAKELANGHTDNGVKGHQTNGVNGHQTNGFTNGEAKELTNGHHDNNFTNGMTNGTNGHQTVDQSEAHGLTNGTNGHQIIDQSKVIVLSAKDEASTQVMAANLKDYLTTTTIKDEGKFLDNLAYTLGERRTRFPWASAQSVQSVSSLVKAIESDKMKPARTTGRPRVGFVFTGQGAQWYAMGRELIEAYPVFKASLLEAQEYLKEFGATFSVMGKLKSLPSSVCNN